MIFAGNKDKQSQAESVGSAFLSIEKAMPLNGPIQ